MGKGSGLIRHAKARTDAVQEAVRRTQVVIEKEIEAHGGLYPYNGGRLSEAEFCRRANISQITLLGEAHRQSTKVELQKWFDGVRAGLPRGKRNIKKAVTQRAETWKQRHDQLASQYHLAELEMIGLRQKVAGLEKQNKEQRETIARLQAELSNGKVVRLPDRS